MRIARHESPPESGGTPDWRIKKGALERPL